MTPGARRRAALLVALTCAGLGTAGTALAQDNGPFGVIPTVSVTPTEDATGLPFGSCGDVYIELNAGDLTADDFPVSIILADGTLGSCDLPEYPEETEDPDTADPWPTQSEPSEPSRTRVPEPPDLTVVPWPSSTSNRLAPPSNPPSGASAATTTAPSSGPSRSVTSPPAVTRTTDAAASLPAAPTIDARRVDPLANSNSWRQASVASLIGLGIVGLIVVVWAWGGGSPPQHRHPTGRHRST